jgi:hypothetical protein
MLVKNILKRLTCVTMAAFFIIHAAVYAQAVETETPYDVLARARYATHRDSPFRLRGEARATFSETLNGRTNSSRRYYSISGYGMDARETMLQFMELNTGTTQTQGEPPVYSFLLKPEGIYAQSGQPPGEWSMQDLINLLPRFIAMGMLDQFFMLEILNGDRLPLYAEYMTFGTDALVLRSDCYTVNIDINRRQFSQLAAVLTADIPALLGDAARGMSAFQLALIQRFAQGIFTGLDADLSFVVYIQKDTGRILRIESQMDMANPYGSRLPNANPRVVSEATVNLVDFGRAVTRVDN